MPISPEFAASNQLQNQRLHRLIDRLTAEMLAVRLPKGWTVAVALAHLAFWDRQRLLLMKRWSAGDWCLGSYDGDLFNEVLLPFLQQIPTDQAASMALKYADEVDAFLLEISDELVAQALARADRPNLDRGSHRAGHIDCIEAALIEAGHLTASDLTR